jgi:midasin (ATPase involved in ribosome maturation)
MEEKGLLANLFPRNENGAVTIDPTELVKSGLSRLIDFFTEFEFEPNFRFVNTLSHSLAVSSKAGTQYIKNYFELIDSPYAPEITEKMKSLEFKSILKDLANLAPARSVNNRFKIYYGSAGTGKTTKAQQETENRCIVCNNSMLPADLMEDFVFVDGKATFKPSMLWRCMEEGRPITMDEINLLPFDSLRFLQGILDGKTEFQYKGNTVHIKDGFMVIGTMNLSVNGMVYGLPEPLIDRAAEMRQFKLTADNLLAALA